MLNFFLLVPNINISYIKNKKVNFSLCITNQARLPGFKNTLFIYS